MDESIDLRQFRYFLAVSEERNIGRAAQRLHISQPPLSRQIRLLEEQLGVPLFVRGKAGVTLTDAGRAFLPEVRRTLAQADKALAAARAAHGQGQSGGRFLIGYTTVVDRSAIPDLAGPLRERFPDWQIATRGKHSISLVRDIRNGSMDAAFIGLHTDTQGLAAHTVHEAPLVVALAASHPLARKRRLGFDELRGEALFWFERRLNPGYYDHCQAFFERIGFQPERLAEPADHHVLLGLIAEGQGIALLPASLQQVKRQGVVFRALKQEGGTLSMGIALIHAAGNGSLVLRELLELLKTGPG